MNERMCLSIVLSLSSDPSQIQHHLYKQEMPAKQRMAGSANELRVVMLLLTLILSVTCAFQTPARICFHFVPVQWDKYPGNGMRAVEVDFDDQVDKRDTNEDLSNNSGSPRQRTGRRFSQAAFQPSSSGKTANNPSKFDPDRMWKSQKSIEQLEERLTARWGTDLSTWTAADLDGDDDDDDDNNSTNTATSNEKISDRKRDKLVAVPATFRARPVIDPWKSREENVSNTKPNPSPFLDTNEEGDTAEEKDAGIRRARKNQERLRANKVKSLVETNPSRYSDDTVDDDKRLNHSDRSDAVNLRVDDLISPRPVGGKGTFQKEERMTSRETYIFTSNANNAKADLEDAPRQGETVEKVRDERPKQPLIPILDENGQPKLLTCTQAELEFRSLLGTTEKKSFDSSSPDITTAVAVNGEVSWDDLGIKSEVLLKNLHSMGCHRPLSVQVKSCPSVLESRDVLIGMYTGSGKTLGFLVPLLERLLTQQDRTEGNVRIIVVAPGRELCSQIVSVTRDLLQGTNLTALLAIGGTTFSRNLELIRKRKPTILVGTPGRIAELVVGSPGERNGRLKINDVQTLVLDEFDALLEYKPHRDPTNALIQKLKQQRGKDLQSILCSATASDVIGSGKLDGILRQGYKLALADQGDLLVTTGGDDLESKTRVSRTVIHGVVHVPHRRLTLTALRRILHTEPLPQQILIFAEDSHRVKIVVEKLGEMGIIAAPLYGGARSEKIDRADVSKALREGYVGIVVATELAARGLDAPLLTHVVNLDLPTDASHYAHRAGRCGRGGRPGVVINITSSPKERNVPQKFANQLGIPLFTVEPRNGKLNIVDPSSIDLS